MNRYLVKPGFVPAALFIAGLLAYAGCFHNGFMMDDAGFFFGNKITPASILRQFLPDPSHSYYRPLAHVIPSMCYLVFGQSAWAYHVFNFVLFWFSACLLFLLVRQVFDDPILAFLTSFFYLVHPINGVVVNYITAGVYAAQVIFMLAGLWFISSSVIPAKAGIHNNIISFFFFLLALLCHETSMAFPLYALALLKVAPGQSWKKAIKITLPFFILLAAYFIFRLYVASFNRSVFSHISAFHLDWLVYFSSLGKIIGWYLAKLTYPSGIVLMWIAPLKGPLAGGFLIWIVLALLAWRLWRSKEKAVRLGLLWFLGGLLPVCFGSLAALEMGFLVEPHWLIFPSIGIFLMLAALLKPSQHRLLTAVLIVLVWAGVENCYNFLWSNQFRYCSYWLKEAPDFKAPGYFLAKAYEDQGNYTMARFYYRQSFLHRYKDWLVYSSLGNLDLKMNDLEQAKKDLIMALNLEPHSSGTLNSLGYVFFRQKEYAKAGRLFRMAMAADPFSLMARNNLALTMINEGRIKEAQAIFEGNLKMVPDDPYSLGALRRLNGQ